MYSFDSIWIFILLLYPDLRSGNLSVCESCIKFFMKNIARTRTRGPSVDPRTSRAAEVDGEIPSIGNGRQLRELYKLSFRRGAETLPRKTMALSARRFLTSLGPVPLVPSFHPLRVCLHKQSFIHDLDLRILHHDGVMRRIVPICSPFSLSRLAYSTREPRNIAVLRERRTDKENRNGRARERTLSI